MTPGFLASMAHLASTSAVGLGVSGLPSRLAANAPGRLPGHHLADATALGTEQPKETCGRLRAGML